MRRLGRVLFAACLLLGACGPEYPQTPHGRWMARCARCHEVDGSSTTASEQAGRPVDLRTPRFQSEFSDLRIRHIVIHGEGKMQGISGIRDAEVDSILRYVRELTEQGPGLLDTPAPTP
jgi:mono/diheme cytochrome c family protein